MNTATPLKMRLYRWAVWASIVSLFATILWFFFGDRFAVIRSVGNDSFSLSAIGHHAFLKNLKANHLAIEISTFETDVQSQNADLVISLEPYISSTNSQIRDDFQNFAYEAPVLLVAIPKRWGAPPDLRSKHISNHGLEFQSDVEFATSWIANDLDLFRTPTATCTDLNGTPFTLQDAQLFKPHVGQPLITCDAGTLVTRVDAPNPRWLVADPDIFANFRQDEPHIAELSRNLVLHILAGKTRVVLDETAHGHVRPPTIGRFLTTWPVAALTGHLGFVFLTLVWTALIPFGRRRRAELELPLGKEAMIQNAAELMTFGGHSGHMLGRYLDAILSDICERLHAPGLKPNQRIDWVQSRIDARGLTYDLKKISETVDTLAFARGPMHQRQILNTARELHQMRQDLLHD